jgi:competence protein ComEC
VQDILNKKVTSKKIPKRVVRRGEVYDLGAGVLFTILYPNIDVSKIESNAGSIVARLTYGDHSFLLTGDAPTDSELLLVGADQDMLRSTVLKLGHHGSDTSTHVTFLSHVKPQYAVVSAGENNSYNHPHPDVVDRIKKFGSILLKTADWGTITFSTNGRVIEVLGLPEDSQEVTPE